MTASAFASIKGQLGLKATRVVHNRKCILVVKMASRCWHVILGSCAGMGRPLSANIGSSRSFSLGR